MALVTSTLPFSAVFRHSNPSLVKPNTSSVEAPFFPRIQNWAIDFSQWCKFLSNNLNFARESRADGGGAEQNGRGFHALPDSETYTTEYVAKNPAKNCHIVAFHIPARAWQQPLQPRHPVSPM